MNWLIDIFSSGGMGAAIGLIGGIAQKFVDLRAKRLEYGYNREMRKLDLEDASLERSHELDMADKQVERAKVEGELDVDEIEAKAFEFSQKNAGKNTVLTYIRAGITVYLLLVATWLSALVFRHAGGIEGMSHNDLVSLLGQIVNTCMFLTVTCVTWWFAARDGNLRFKK